MTRAKLFLFIATLAAMVAVFRITVSPALAADLRQSVLTSAGSGAATNVVAVANTKGTYGIQCRDVACYRVTQDAGTVDCSQDPVIQGGFTTPRAVEMSGYKYIQAVAWDGGTVDCRVLLQTKNPTFVK